MRPIANPPNPYTSRYAEWLGPPPRADVQVYLDESRSILSENDSPDLPFRWSVNPYRGCQHGCPYCYARPTHEYYELGAGTDFETRIIVKPDAPRLLAEAFSRKSWKRENVSFSGVTDCYQPLEAAWELTRGCLEVCAEFRNPVSIVTKSYLIVRDIDLLLRLSRRSSVHVYCSIAFADDALARRVEPNAPPPSRRFEALRQLSAAGLRVGVMVAPVIPALNDREIPAVLERAAELGARSATYSALRLPGSVQTVFFERLREQHPEAAHHVESRVRAMRGGRLNDSRFGWRFRGGGPYWESVERLFEVTARRLGLNGLECRRDERGGQEAARSEAARPPTQLPLF